MFDTTLNKHLCYLRHLRPNPSASICGSALVSVGAKLHACAVGIGEIELVTACRPIGWIAIDTRFEAEVAKSRRDFVRVVIFDANAEVMDGSRIREFIEPKKTAAESEVDAAVAWTAHHVETEELRIKLRRTLDV